MAGPGIRYLEFARDLARRHDVTLAAPVIDHIDVDGFTLMPTAGSRLDMRGFDVCITQIIGPKAWAAARRNGVRIIADLYCPFVIEALEADRGFAPHVQRARNRRLLAATRLLATHAHAVLCAGERQRDLWLGALLALDRVRPETYVGDRGLTSLIRVVPFGLPGHQPTRTGPGPRELFGLDESHTLLLWGGGIWAWLDPLTLLDAMAVVARTRSDVHLAFMGMNRPRLHTINTSMMDHAVSHAEDLGLRDRQVWFNSGWVGYEERQNWLLDADVGVSTHFSSLETRYAFRTRMLDYLWAGLPIIATEGDEIADTLAHAGASVTVPAGDRERLAEQILAFVEDHARLDRARVAAREAAERYRWDVVVEPLSRLIDEVVGSPVRRRGLGCAADLAVQTVGQGAAQLGARMLGRRASTGPVIK
jgi:glycosyltransferase involved in cell wall biosynthesis